MFNGQRLDAIDTRWVFRIYAALAGLTGTLLFAWGPLWFGTDLSGERWGEAAIIRVLGSIMLAVACWAVGFATVDPPTARRRALLWFAIGHAVISLAVISQQVAVWGPGLAEQIAWVLLVVAMALFYLWSTSEGDIVPRTLISLFGRAAPDATTQLRSQYEQQIRESARQEERNRLARDLHDSVKQQIFVIQTSAATAQARFGGDPAGASEALEQIRVSAREAMTEMQAMLDQLRAVPLENPGLIEALKAQCEALGFRTGARVEFKLADLPPAVDLPPGAHEAILRVAQEALANVGRHARACNVLVTLGSFRGQVELGIKDDGSGFDPEHSRRGQGLANIRARAEEFSGKFEIISRPGGGTYVAFSFPYTSGLTPREYRNRATLMAVALGLLILEFAWIKTLWILPWLLLASVGVIRYLVAYRRARLRGEAARCHRSPSY